MYVALEKRQASAENIDKALQNIFNRCITNQEKEISTLKIGEFVMQELLRLDHVAYVRYASVYLSFNEIDAFKKLVANALKVKISKTLLKLFENIIYFQYLGINIPVFLEYVL